MNQIRDFVAGRAIGLWLAVGMLIGFVGSGAVAAQWIEAGSGTRIQILGSGSRLSVLITHDQRRVLIVSGTDGTALANAVGDVLPPIFDTIDVTLVDPSSSPDVVERARNLDTRQIFVLPADGVPETAQSIEQSFAIDLGYTQPLIVEVHDSNWTISIGSGAGTVVAGSGESLARQGVIEINIDGTRRDDGDDGPELVIAPTGQSDEQSGRHATVHPGAVMTITFDESAFRLDREFFPEQP